MKKLVSVCLIMALALSLVACGTDFDGSRIGNDSEFIMEYKMLNTTDSQDLNLEAGDKIKANIVVDSGDVAVKIEKDGEPVYEGEGLVSYNEFTVTAEESGIYKVTVTGKKAKGSVSFTVDE